MTTATTVTVVSGPTPFTSLFPAGTTVTDIRDLPVTVPFGGLTAVTVTA